jgi:hypothetical protein
MNCSWQQRLKKYEMKLVAFPPFHVEEFQWQHPTSGLAVALEVKYLLISAALVEKERQQQLEEHVEEKLSVGELEEVPTDASLEYAALGCA